MLVDFCKTHFIKKESEKCVSTWNFTRNFSFNYLLLIFAKEHFNLNKHVRFLKIRAWNKVKSYKTEGSNPKIYLKKIVDARLDFF